MLRVRELPGFIAPLCSCLFLCGGAGHKHSYLRTYPVYNNSVSKSYDNPAHTVHFIVGGAGCDEMGGKTETAPEVGGAAGAKPGWEAAKNTEDYGMGILRVESVSTPCCCEL